MRRGRDAAVEFADDHRAVIAAHDAAGGHVVSAVVDEAAHHPVLAHDLADDELVQAVLRGQHEAVGGEVRQQRPGGRIGVVRLHRQHDAAPRALQLGGRDGAHLLHELLDRALDLDAVAVHGRDVVGVDVDEEHVVPRARPCRAERAADRPRSPDEDRAEAGGFGVEGCGLAQSFGHDVSRSSRVSSTPASHSDCISSSDF